MNYILHILILITIYSILALTLNMLIGYLGILQLAHPALYFGFGAYGFAILSSKGFSFFPALLCAGLIALGAGLVLAIPSLRLKSHYIAIASLGFLIITHGLIVNLRGVTRGALGFPGIPRPEIFGFSFQSNSSFFLLVLVFALIIGFILHRILHSPFGKIMESIREDESAAKTLGKHTLKYKIQVFALSSFFAGIAGALLGSYLGFINATNVNIDEIIFSLAMVIVGGMASFWGSIVGAAIILFIPEPLRFLDLPVGIIGPMRYALYGLILILFMLYRPNGILGKRTNVFSKL